MQSTVILFLMTSCLNLLARAEMQSADVLSLGAAPEQTPKQRQRYQQQLQQQLSTRHSLGNTAQQSPGVLRPNNKTHNQLGESEDIERNGLLTFNNAMNTPSTDSYSNIVGFNSNSAAKGSLVSDNRYIQSYVEDNLHTPVRSQWAVSRLPVRNQHLTNNVKSQRTFLSSQDQTDNSQTGDHRLDKREAVDTYPTSLGQTEPDFLDQLYPLYLDRGFKVLTPSIAAHSSPYLSTQEFKETFRRSDPYFMGKRDFDDVPGEDALSEDKRRAPYFVGKRASTNIVDNYLADLLSDGQESSLTSNFIGRRGAPYFVGKRRAPLFVGKRSAELQSENEISEDKRAAPKFVGRRGAPYFVGKREPTGFVEDIFTELPSNDDLNWILENKKGVGRRGAPYFVGKRGPPMFVGKRSAPMFVGKRGAPMFVGKRGPPMFVGKRGPPMFVGKRGPPMFVGKRGPPMFVGKRGPPMFIGKRWSEYDTQDDIPSPVDSKRRAPKFIGRRGSPYFVGKREPDQPGEHELTEFDSEDEIQQTLEDKRAAPKFIGRRDAPFFVGKRRAPMFVGKRLDDTEWITERLASDENKRSAPKFIGRRGPPYFVGKRDSPYFVGKRALYSLNDGIVKPAVLNQENAVKETASIGWSHEQQFQKADETEDQR